MGKTSRTLNEGIYSSRGGGETIFRNFSKGLYVFLRLGYLGTKEDNLVVIRFLNGFHRLNDRTSRGIETSNVLL